MNDLKAALRQKAAALLGRLSPPEREALLVKCWMSHDARWFMAVAREFGMEVANRLNQIAAHEVGKAEAQRLVRALGLGPVASVDDYLLAQELFIGLLGPDLLDYRVTKVGDNCGIFARLTGWVDALGLAYETSPPLGKCLKARGRECGYTITLAIKPE
jgi:hypothetical protein